MVQSLVKVENIDMRLVSKVRDQVMNLIILTVY